LNSRNLGGRTGGPKAKKKNRLEDGRRTSAADGFAAETRRLCNKK